MLDTSPPNEPAAASQRSVSETPTMATTSRRPRSAGTVAAVLDMRSHSQTLILVGSIVALLLVALVVRSIF
jgi:hypothetical protein